MFFESRYPLVIVPAKNMRNTDKWERVEKEHPGSWATPLPKIRDQDYPIPREISASFLLYPLSVTSPKKVTFSGRNSKPHFVKPYNTRNNNRTLGRDGLRIKDYFQPSPPYEFIQSTCVPYRLACRLVKKVVLGRMTKVCFCEARTKQILEIS